MRKFFEKAEIVEARECLMGITVGRNNIGEAIREAIKWE